MRRWLTILILLAAAAWAQPAALLEALKAPQAATSLQLAGLGLEVVPPEVTALTNLQQLVLNENKLTALPEGLGPKLEVLWVAGNRITRWPASLARCPLRDLDAGRNGLTEVPSVVWELGGLKTLSLRQNQLASLPRDVSRLTALEVLDVSKNRLASMPVELSLCKRLKVLDMSGNPVSPAEQARLKAALPGVDITF